MQDLKEKILKTEKWPMAFFQDKTTYVKKRYFYLTEIKVNLAKFDFHVTVLFFNWIVRKPKSFISSV